MDEINFEELKEFLKKYGIEWEYYYGIKIKELPRSFKSHDSVIKYLRGCESSQNLKSLEALIYLRKGIEKMINARDFNRQGQ